VTAEEADAWLAKLEAGEDAKPPECHLSQSCLKEGLQWL
jgi:hypothetical protein